VTSQQGDWSGLKQHLATLFSLITILNGSFEILIVSMLNGDLELFDDYYFLMGLTNLGYLTLAQRLKLTLGMGHLFLLMALSFTFGQFNLFYVMDL